MLFIYMNLHFSKLFFTSRRSQTASPIYEENKKEDDAQDIKTAALALTSLSLSPAVTGKNEGIPCS